MFDIRVPFVVRIFLDVKQTYYNYKFLIVHPKHSFSLIMLKLFALIIDTCLVALEDKFSKLMTQFVYTTSTTK